MSGEPGGAWFERVQSLKRREREARIDRLVAAARDRGEDVDRIFWSIVHDLEEAPMTTNRRQLVEIRAPVPVSDAIPGLSDGAVRAVLDRLIEDLARLQVFLCRTEHLDDRSLLRLLLTRIIEEPVPDLPASRGMRDWIDCSEFPGTHPVGSGAGAEVQPEPGAGRDRRLPRPG